MLFRSGTVLDAGLGQTLSVTFTPTDQAGYLVAQSSATIDVVPAALTVTAENRSKVYGQDNPLLTASYTGFVNGEASGSLDVAVNLSTTATASSPVGEYPIVASGAGDVNYGITYVEGTLTVEPNAKFTDITFEGERQVRLTFTGLAGRVYRIELSTNLKEWREVAAIETAGNGIGTYLSPPGVANPVTGFYRIAWP